MKKRTEIIVKDNIDIVNYTIAVQKIVEKFFDDEGNYTPHFGKTNAVGVFFSYFVDNVSLDAHFAEIENLDIPFLISDDECLLIYNDALCGNGGFRLDFANAYSDAIEIVNYKISSFGNVIDNIKKAISIIADKISPVFEGENIDKISEIAKQISSGNLSADSIVKAVGKRLEEEG